MTRREFLQLAKSYNPEKNKIAGWYLSEKLDGTRCFWDGGITRGMDIATIIEGLAQMLDVTGAAESHVTLDYQRDDIAVKPGDLIPYISIGIRQATIKNEHSTHQT